MLIALIAAASALAVFWFIGKKTVRGECFIFTPARKIAASYSAQQV
ncbi:MAG: hypothetical protein LBU39_02105 [Desulfobulbaceae bacterium]|nr:hypothetical protein [Desulfobulbaceae bacterium]